MAATACGWLWPQWAWLSFVPAIVLVPAALVYLFSGTRADRRWSAQAMAPLLVYWAMAFVNDRLADAGMLRIREAVIAHYERTGAYPDELEELVGSELDVVPDAGLPFVERMFSYGLSSAGRPVLSYTYAMPFGRRMVRMSDGSIVSLG